MPIVTAPELKPLEYRIVKLGELLGRLKPVPEDWLDENRASKRKGGGTSGGELVPIPCESWDVVVSAWRKALKWIDGLDCALSVMLASVTSTRAVGDQLWVKIQSPASTGKSDLCEALAVNARYVLAKSTIRGFHSGWRESRGDGGEDEEDTSLIAQIRNKTLVTKDGDTLLQSPNLPQILSEGRDLYDSVSRSHYRNNMGKDYKGVRFTWILAGTSSLKQIDQSELGERFLDCVIMDKIDDDLEDEILWRVVNRSERNLSLEADDKNPESQYDPEKLEAMCLTAGYIDYLRLNATELLSGVFSSEQAMRLCTRYGKFVAFMRARPSKKQDEQSEREMAARLVSQHHRLAKCLAVVLNRKELDEEVMRRTRKVALDTARGPVFNLTTYLYKKAEGVESSGIEFQTGMATDKAKQLITFLRRIEVIEPLKTGRAGPTKWILTAKLRKLYAEVVVQSGLGEASGSGI